MLLSVYVLLVSFLYDIIRPPGRHTFQSCTIGAAPKSAGKKKTRYPAGLRTRLAGAEIYIYIYIYIHIYIYIYIYYHIYIYIYYHIYIYIYYHIYIYIWHIYIYIHMHTYVMYVYVCVCIYIYIYIYTYMYTLWMFSRARQATAGVRRAPRVPFCASRMALTPNLER